MNKKIKVLIVDDSGIVRDLLERGLSSDPEIEVVGKAIDSFNARDKIVFLRPDVVTLDVEMPKMNGVEFLRRLMPQYPIPVVMVSSLTKKSSKVTLDALGYGAIDFVLKPSSLSGSGLKEMIIELRDKIKVAAKVDVSGWKDPNYRKKQKSIAEKHASQHLKQGSPLVIAIGASLGGTIAITQVVNGFPENIPGTVIVQHMPPVFTKHFAESLNKSSKVHVKEAEDGDRINTGQVLIAPGGLHTRVVKRGTEYFVDIKPGEPVSGHCPSVDVLFSSVSKHVKSKAIGVILTGMGYDGAKGLLEMKKQGAKTIGQDKETSIVFGMPAEAQKIGATERMVSLNEVTTSIIQIINELRE